ncbi:MAG: DUF2254 family protein, partial [Acidimicrobiia bacterium]|nr:DUF2254 family protein [Acidimicrobiia bacterium]
MESLRSAAQRLRESLFLVPTAVMVVCIGLAGLARWLDRAVPGVEDLPVLLSVSLDGGRSIVTAVAGATITVAAIVFSITALSSQIASSQFSPRSVGGFFDNRFQQVVIGLVVGTFAYSLLVLGGLAGQDGTGAGQFRSVSVTLAVVLGIGSGIAIVAYIDHSLRRMRVNAVVRRIALATVAAVRRTHRSARAETDDGGMQHEGIAVPARAASLGWVRSIDGARLARILPPGAVARV